MIAKYKINEEVYVVQEYRIVKCKIEKIIVTETTQGKSLVYDVSPLYTDKKKTMSFIEAYLVKTLDEAKQSALANWERITRDVKRNIETLTEKKYKEKVKLEENA